MWIVAITTCIHVKLNIMQEEGQIVAFYLLWVSLITYRQFSYLQLIVREGQV